MSAETAPCTPRSSKEPCSIEPESTPRDTPRVLLIHPPLVRPGEPPAGLAQLAGALRFHRIHHRVIDANMEGLQYLLKSDTGIPSDAGGNGAVPDALPDTWTRRARRRLDEHLALVKDRRGYGSIDRYRRAVLDICRVLQKSVDDSSVRISLSDYEDRTLSPLNSGDLIRAAERPADNPFHAYFRERLLRQMEIEPFSVAGFSLNYLSQALCCFAMIGFLRQLEASITIVLGGGLVTSWLSRPGWRSPFRGLVDQCMAGPGEGPLLSMLGVTPARDDTTPDYGAFPLSDYLSPGFVLPYSASRGCYWRQCTFCPEKAEENPYRPMPSGRVARDLRLLQTGREPALLHFLDNAMSPALLRTLAGEPVGVPWYGFARISSEMADPEFCMALRRAGCVMLKLGIESGSQRVLDDLHKGMNLETASKALSALKAAGIAAYVYLLFGTPAENEADAFRTLDFTVRHHERIGFLNVAVFNLPAFSPEAETMETESFYEGDLSLYRTFVHPAGWSRTSVRNFLNRTFKRHPAVAPILRRDPPYFTSGHAPFFAMDAIRRT